MDKVTIRNSTLYCGDWRNVIKDLQFDSIITDPPYGMSAFTKKPWEGRYKKKNLHSGGTWAAKEIYQDVDWDDEAPDLTFLLELNRPAMVFGGNYFANLPPSRKWIVWDKGEQFYRRSFAECELCYCNFDGNTRMIKCSNEFVTRKQTRLHPTQKPVAVMKFCISELPKGCGNIICDPYMGSGTTGVAAIQMGRAFIGIEQKEKYFEIACQRIERAYAEYENQFPEVREMIETKKLFD